MNARATEAECQATLIAAAKVLGWRVHAERAARSGSSWSTPISGHAGFPDLVLVRDAVLAFVELKRRPNRLEVKQLEWHYQMRKAGAVVRVWWMPEELDRALAWLQHPSSDPGFGDPFYYDELADTLSASAAPVAADIAAAGARLVQSVLRATDPRLRP